MTLFNPILANLPAFQAMSNGRRRLAGKRARQDASNAGYPKKAGKRVIRLPDGSKATLTMFSAQAEVG